MVQGAQTHFCSPSVLQHMRERERERHCALLREGERVLLRDMETDTLDSERHRTHQRQRELRDSSKVLRKDTGFALKFVTKDVFYKKSSSPSKDVHRQIHLHVKKKGHWK